ncbi:ATP-binding cassette domain-containing protein [Streptococcus cuniculipharyngis]|uniref:ATP-binding cassette domain-containing protein n=1 Tax=Streptococcus cuniculipharyngis TaxID=1562651 RepID=A0A5C5S9Q8_9STRE|nr:ATP-binding cassette domain-containing protein [Streptococcus cuniculipharyngis]
MELSGGEQKRIALARFLLAPKPFLLIDELSAGLDKDALKQLEALVLQLPVSLIYISHQNLDQLRLAFDQVIDLTDKM